MKSEEEISAERKKVAGIIADKTLQLIADLSHDSPFCHIEPDRLRLEAICAYIIGATPNPDIKELFKGVRDVVLSKITEAELRKIKANEAIN